MRLELLLESYRKILIDSRRPFELSAELSDHIPLLASLDDPPKITAQRTLDDAIQAWRLDAILLLAYVNRMDGFSGIPKEERMLMIKTFAMKFVTITTVMRTYKFGDDSCFILANNFSSAVNGAHLFELSSKAFGDTSMWTDVRMKIREELMLPTVDLKLTNEEYVAIKAIMFWNADLPGISAATKDKAKAKRELLLDELYEHIRMHLPEKKAAQRFGSILLLCGAFSSCSLAAAESMGLAKFFNVLNFDQYITDLMFSS